MMKFQRKAPLRPLSIFLLLSSPQNLYKIPIIPIHLNPLAPKPPNPFSNLLCKTNPHPKISLPSSLALNLFHGYFSQASPSSCPVHCLHTLFGCGKAFGCEKGTRVCDGCGEGPFAGDKFRSKRTTKGQHPTFWS